MTPSDWRARAGELRTVPNLVSLSRLPLVAAIVLAPGSVWRYPLFALVVLSDAVDGWLARRLDQETELGALLDPALDKFTALALFVAFFPRAGLATEYVVLFFARDAFVVSLGVLVTIYGLDIGTVKARLPGKAVTNLQFWTLIAMLVPHAGATRALMWGVGVASALAIADYALFVARELSDAAWVHDRRGAVGAYAAVGLTFAVLVRLVLYAELRGFLAAV